MMEFVQAEANAVAANGPPGALGWLDLFVKPFVGSMATGGDAARFPSLLAQLALGGITPPADGFVTPTKPDDGAVVPEQDIEDKAAPMPPEALAYWVAALAGSERLPLPERSRLPVSHSQPVAAASPPAIATLLATAPRLGEPPSKMTTVNLTALLSNARDGNTPAWTPDANGPAAMPPTWAQATMPSPVVVARSGQGIVTMESQPLVPVNPPDGTFALPDAASGPSFPQTTVPLFADTESRGNAVTGSGQHAATDTASVAESASRPTPQATLQAEQPATVSLTSRPERGQRANNSATGQQPTAATAPSATQAPSPVPSAATPKTEPGTTPQPVPTTPAIAPEPTATVEAMPKADSGATTPTTPERAPATDSHTATPGAPTTIVTRPTALPETPHAFAATETATTADATPVKAAKETVQAKDAPQAATQPGSAPETAPTPNPMAAVAPPPSRPVAAVSEATAAEPTGHTPDDTLTPGPDMAERLSARIGLAAQRGETEWRMKIHPPALGALDVRLTASGDGVAVQMRTETEGARGLLHAHLDELRQTLQERGVRVEALAVSVTDERQSSGFHFGQQRSWQGPEGQPRPTAYPPPTGGHTAVTTAVAATRSIGSRAPTHRLDILA